MPVYTYTCPKCNKIEQLLCPFEERDKQACQECKRVMTRAPIEMTGNPKWICTCETASGGKPCQD